MIVTLAAAQPVPSGAEPPKEFRIWAFGDVPTTKGTFKFDAEAAKDIVAEQRKRGVDKAGDYEHASLDGASAANGAPTPLWYELEARPDGLWAVNVRWTPRAAEYLKSGEYRYFSPAFYTDPKTKRITGLINIALTNDPATIKLPALVAAKAMPFEADLPIGPVRPFRHDDVLPRVRKWASSDGSGDKDKIDWSKYAKAWLWHDPENPENFGSYKLKFCDVINGKLTAMPKGIEEAGAIIDGSRGGVDIPESDRPGVKATLEKYYRKLNKTAPWERHTSGVRAEGEHMETLLKMLGLTAEATEAQAVAALTEMITATDGKDVIDAKAQIAALKQKSTTLEAGGAELLKLTDTKTSSEAMGTVAAWKASHEQVQKLTTRVAELEGAAKSTEVDSIVEAAVRDAKIPPAMKEFWLEQGKKDLVALKTFVEKAPAIVSTKDTAKKPQNEGTEAEEPDLTEAEKKMAKKLNITHEQMKKRKAARAKKADARDGD